MKKSILIAILLLLGLSLHATTFWWDGSANLVLGQSDNANVVGQNWLNDGLWDDGTNSLSLASWNPGDSAIFGGSAASQTITAGTLTIGNMTFGAGGDGSGTNGTAYTISGGSLTLTNTLITINTPTTISSPLVGSSSLTTWGAATLTLSGTSTYTGGTIVSNSTLTLAGGNGGTTGTIRGGLTIGSGAQVNASTSWGMGYANGTCVNSITLNGGTLNFTGTPDNGGTSMSTLTMTGGNVSGSHFDWYNGITSTPTLATLASSATATISSGFRMRLSNNQLTANIAQGTPANGIDLLISGAISSAFASDGLTKSGAGVLGLSGVNTYTGTTIVSGGLLWVSGLLASGSAVTVQSGGALAGTGTINGSVTLQSGATLGAGSNNIGTLNLGSTLTLNAGSTNFMRVNKTGATLTADKIKMIGSSGIAYNGVLTVVANPGSDAFAAGDKFPLFAKAAGTLSGSFVGSNLPALAAGLSWDTGALTVDGSIQVVSTSVTLAPSFNPPAGGYAGAQSVTILSETGSTIYYTTDGSDPTTSGTRISGASPVTGVTVPVPTIGMTIRAYATHAGKADSAVASAAYSTIATPTWSNTSGGSWPTTANWSFNIAANGSGVTADFSTLSLPADATVTVDGARTIGTMLFDDQNVTKHGWTLAPGTGGALTLAVVSGAPVISNNVPTTIGAILAGTQGFTKSGSATLTLTNANTYTGTTTISNGSTLQFGDGLTNNGGVAGNITDNGALIIANPAAQSYSGVVSGAGTLTKTGAGVLTLNGTSTYTGGSTVNGGAITLATGGANGIIRGSLIINGAGTVNPTTTWSLGQGTGGATNIFINGGTLNFTGTADNGGTAVQAITMAGGAISGSHFDWYNGITSTPILTTIATNLTATISSGFRMRLASHNATFVVANGTTTNGVDLLINAPITSNASDGVNKTGAGLLCYAATNTYPGPTTVSGGALLVTGRLSVSPVTVQANGTLIGTGEIDGTTTVQSGGTLAPGGLSNIGVSYLLGKVTTAAGGTNRFRISKDGGIANSDSVVLGTPGVQYGGTLIVSDVTSDGSLLADGDTFTLFQLGPWTGGFTTVILPTNMPAGLGWDVGGLTTSGSIRVTSIAVPAATPTFTPPAGGYVGAQSVVIGCATPGAVIRYTTDGTDPTNTSTLYSGPITVPNSTNLTIKAYATAPGYLVSGEASASYATEPVAVWVTPFGDSWANAANWTNNIIPDGNGITVDISTVTLSGNSIVTLDGAWTVGHLLFGDAGATYNWQLDTGLGSAPLMLVGPTPSVAVNNGVTTITAVLAGSGGWTKTGSGTLQLNTSPTCNGPTTVSSGTLSLANGVTVMGTTALSVSNGAVLNLTGTGQSAISPSVTNWTIAGTINLITASGTAGASVAFPSAGTVIFNGGTLTGDAINNVAGNLLLSGSSGQSFPITANGPSNTISCQSIAGYSAAGNVTYTLALNTPLSGDALAMSSVIHDGPSAVAIALTKSGQGVVTLSGANTYTGTTTVSNGTLLVSGSLSGGSAVAVASGGTLGGSGVISGPVTIQAGGALSTDRAGISTLTLSNTLNLAGNVNLRINAGSLTSDLLQGMTSVTYGGTLTVANLGGTLALGNTFHLFNAAAYTGGFAAMNLPALGTGLAWNWTPANGTLAVVSSVLTPPVVSGFGPLAGNSFPLTFSGPSGQSYKVVTSTDVGQPVSSWTVLTTGIFGGSPVTYNDTGATNAHRFYRIVSP